VIKRDDVEDDACDRKEAESPEDGGDQDVCFE
jgi:hypothetical protein